MRRAAARIRKMISSPTSLCSGEQDPKITEVQERELGEDLAGGCLERGLD